MPLDKIKLDNIEYIRSDLVQTDAIKNTDGCKYVIVRTRSAGVFSGYLKERNGTESTLVNARRLWYWSGAASLSQLAMHGVSNPSDCKFPCEVDRVLLTETIEILDVTEKGRASIAGVTVWKT